MKNNEFKLAVFDIDGTLTVSKDEIPSSTLKAIKELQKKGIHSLLATGRSKKATEKIAEMTGMADSITLNGQYVYFENEVIYEYDYPQKVIERVREICQEIGTYYFLLNERGSHIPDLEEILKTRTSVFLPQNLIKERNVGDPVRQIEIYCEDENLDKFKEFLEEYHFTRWHTGGFDMVAKGRSKSAGIRTIAEKLGIDQSEIICFGDGDNDKDMLAYAGVGVAMGNASDEVKSVADYVTEPVYEDGIYQACQKFGLI